MSSYLELSSIDHRILKKISDLYQDRRIDYQPDKNWVFRLTKDEFGNVRSPDAAAGIVVTDGDGTINVKGSRDPSMIWIDQLVIAHRPVERVKPHLLDCIKQIYIKKDIRGPTQEIASTLKRVGVLEKHMKEAADETPKHVELVPDTLDTYMHLEKNMLKRTALISGGWEYTTKNVGEQLLGIPKDYCYGSDIPCIAGKLVGTMKMCMSDNKVVARDGVHKKSKCSNNFSIQIENDYEIEDKSAITHGLGLNINVDIGPSSSLPRDVKDFLLNGGDAKGVFEFPGTVTVFIPEARYNKKKIIRPIEIWDNFIIVTSLYTVEGYNSMINCSELYRDAHEVCRKATGASFDSNLTVFLNLSYKLIQLSYPPIDVEKVKPNLDKAKSRIPEEERREEMENIFDFMCEKRPELKDLVGNCQYMRDIKNELEPLTDTKR